jgi:predicted DNA-binding transcriptional regulator AlpA
MSAEEIDCQLLSSKQVRAALGNCSDMHIWRLSHDARYAALGFPQRVKIAKRNFWRASELAAWIDAQAAKTPVRPKRPAPVVEAA